MKQIAAPILISAFVTAFACAEVGLAREQPFALSKPPEWGSKSTGPYCGVIAACNAVRLVGIDVEESEYIASKFVGSCGGSSVKEVCAIVEEAGGRACQRTRLSAYDIRMFGGPVIAYVRRNPTDDRFDHWVVAVARDEGVSIYDGFSQPHTIPMAEFLGVWSGIGVLVTRQEDDPSRLLWLSRVTLVLACVASAVLVTPSTTNFRNRLRHMGIRRQAATIIGVTTVVAIVGNAVFGDLQNHGEGVAAATGHLQGKFTSGTLDDALRAASNPTELLIDARRQQDFMLGSIPSAVNVPVTASSWEIREYLADLDKSTPIVVFCQSASCHYDESIAQQLVGLGFVNVTVSDEGWREYSTQPKREQADVHLTEAE